jgi:S1-C subfamily serine protease
MSPALDGLSPGQVKTLLARLRPERPTRGAQDIALYRNVAPSVVLVVTDHGIGSGSLIKGGGILTNWHVVKGFREVGVIFKPPARNAQPRPADVVRATVIKTDERRDLALLRPTTVPDNVKPLELGSLEGVEVGSDVYAIGHPSGASWTYTKGIVSQIRPEYKWKSGEEVEHRATVIQTQTPINPGNSGGPLLIDNEKLVGVNSFKASGAENLNFAVAATEIEAFLKQPASPNPKSPAAAGAASKDEKQDCKPAVLFSGRDKENRNAVEQISLNCDGWPDVTFVTPDDPQLPVRALFDQKKRKKADVIVFGPGRPAKWSFSFWDTELDDTFPIVGRHPDAELKPSSFERRCPNGVARPKFKCG